MNKKTTLLGLLGLVTVAGGGYLYTSGRISQLPQQIGEYLPVAVRDYLPASFSPQALADSSKAAKESSQAISPEANQQTSSSNRAEDQTMEVAPENDVK